MRNHGVQQYVLRSPGGTRMKLGYARVSTRDQTHDGQCQRLSAASCEMLFEEQVSGVARHRPQLEKLVEQLRRDDVLVVTRLDRLPAQPPNCCASPSASPKRRPGCSRLTNRGPTRPAPRAG